MNPKNIVVTGGRSGIGYAISKKLLSMGHNVFVVSRKADECPISDEPNCYPVNIDLMDLESISNGVSQMAQRERFSVDALVNCAGVGYGTPLKDLSLEEYEHIMNTNVRGLIFFTKEILPYIDKPHSVICNISSIAGVRGFEEWGIYCASKYAVEGFSKALRHELRGKKIKVMVVRPGAVDTPLYHFVDDTEKSAFIHPDTIAEVVVHNLFLEDNACTEEILINNSIGDI